MAANSKPRSNSPRNFLEPEYVRSILDYSKSTGVLRWKVRADVNAATNTRCAGKEAGTPDSKGHRQIEIHSVAYMAHHLAWAIVTGEWPTQQIDHQDQDPGNNRWKNLRKCTDTENKCNQKTYKNNRLGCKGVTYRPKFARPYVARITKHGKIHHLGCFATLEEAIAARQEAAIRMHGEFASFN
jgi:hypothetical protein